MPLRCASTSPPKIPATTRSNSNRAWRPYAVPFPAAGTYQLYARVLVGPGGYNSDSLFYGNGFGTQNPTNNSEWIFVNGLAGVGFSNTTDVVTGGGTLGSGMWKWINLSQFTGQAGFTVNAGNLTQTFQIGGRETNLCIDRFVFGSAGDTFTVSNLNNGTDGTPAVRRRPLQSTRPRYIRRSRGPGGATAFYASWIRDHPYKLEIYTNAFAGLNLSMLRLGDWYRYQTPLAGFDSAATDIVSNANRVLGHPVPVFMSSWGAARLSEEQRTSRQRRHAALHQRGIRLHQFRAVLVCRLHQRVSVQWCFADLARAFKMSRTGSPLTIPVSSIPRRTR